MKRFLATMTKSRPSAGVLYVCFGTALRAGGAPPLYPGPSAAIGISKTRGRRSHRGGSEGTEFPLSVEPNRVAGAGESGVEGRSPSAAKQRAKANVQPNGSRHE